jgi:hypothetical protein
LLEDSNPHASESGECDITCLTTAVDIFCAEPAIGPGGGDISSPRERRHFSRSGNCNLAEVPGSQQRKLNGETTTKLNAFFSYLATAAGMFVFPSPSESSLVLIA